MESAWPFAVSMMVPECKVIAGVVEEPGEAEGSVPAQAAKIKPADAKSVHARRCCRGHIVPCS